MIRRPSLSTTVALAAAAVLAIGGLFPPASRAGQVLVAVALLTALGSTGRRFALWLVPDLGALSRATAAATVGALCAVLPPTLLGHFGLLAPAPFLFAQVAIVLLSLLLPERPVSEAAAGPDRPRIEGRDREPGGISPRARLGIATALVLAAALVVAGVGARDVVRTVGDPDGSYGPDGISYHMAMVATWHRTGDLRTMKFAVGDPSPAFYPMASELASWALLAPFGDSDVLARRSQLFFTLFACLAIAAIARRLGLSRRSQLLAALLFVSIEPVFPALALSACNDPTAAFFLLAALDGSLALALRPRAGTAVYAGLGYGLLAGTKYLGLLYGGAQLAVLLAAWAVWSVARRSPDVPSSARAPRPTFPRFCGLLALGVGAAFVACGYPYLRNLVTAGNPVFPEPVHLFGRPVLPGWEGVTLALRKTLPDFKIDTWSFLTARPDLFGPFFPFTLLPAALLAPLVALVALRRRSLAAAAVLALPAVFFLAFRFVVHDHRDSRYLLAAIALAAVALAWLAERAGPRLGSFLAGGAGLLALLATLSRVHLHHGWRYIVPALVAAGAVAAGRLIARRRAGEPLALPVKLRGWPVAFAAAALIACLIAPLGRAVEAYQGGRFRERPVARALDAAAGPRGTRVAYVGLNVPYLYFGRALQNDVEIVPTSWELDARYYTFGGSPAIPRDDQPLFRRWGKILEALDIDYVVVDRSQWEEPQRGWMEANRDRFVRLTTDGKSELWKIVRGSAGAGVLQP